MKYITKKQIFISLAIVLLLGGLISYMLLNPALSEPEMAGLYKVRGSNGVALIWLKSNKTLVFEWHKNSDKIKGIACNGNWGIRSWSLVLENFLLNYEEKTDSFNPECINGFMGARPEKAEGNKPITIHFGKSGNKFFRKIK